ncbi:phosphatase PAP2 family protein [Methylobacterium sp. WSM2598]|uniref:phosphatase PAP2 family protein n=2 Tax=Methylobacterium TaxID=407 RepID=UPI000A079BC7|nr:phosphatase PAP2 family protein [Methylobacterium sp. WSM2598]
MLTTIDNYFLDLMGRFAGHNALLDRFVIKFLDLDSVKCLPFIMCIVYFWYRKSDRKSYKIFAIGAVISVFTAILTSRLTQNLLPMRLRPLHSGDSNFIAPIGTKIEIFEHWSSFPSDSSAYAFALSTAIWYASRSLGSFFYAWSIFVMCLPRIYAGYHYATDIIAGAIIGISTAMFVRFLLPINTISRRVEAISTTHPGLFNVAFFVLMFLLTTQFSDIRTAFASLFKAA